MKTEVTFTYKNYRGEISVRLVRPVLLAFGSTGFHPEPQWLLHAWDLNKEAERTFAMKDISDWDPALQSTITPALDAAIQDEIEHGPASIVAEAGAQYAKAIDDLNRTNDKGEVMRGPKDIMK